jgi:aspartyl-tRNA(Asn)/glutamyl-tRNA(Gln) amidotransferase subunit B
MSDEYEPVIGLEIHAEMQTKSKMFCGCPVVDNTSAQPNVAVCPICSGMPGVLPVINQRAVEYAIRVALALGCEINTTSIFARKNYFYPDLPKGYQISQYEQPLARNGKLTIRTSEGERVIRVRRVHLEEDTGKLTHIDAPHPNPSPSGRGARGEGYSLVDLNRAGVPLLEIVSEPDIRSGEEARAYGEALRNILRYLGVNSGDLQKGVMRIEPNVSVRPMGSNELGTRTEIKNLNSFRALERGIAYEIQRQSEILQKGGQVQQETVGWDEGKQATFIQRVKEGDEDYRYFPEPDLPPLVVSHEWIEEIRAALPELPEAKSKRFKAQYALSDYDAEVLVNEQRVADYYEQTVTAAPGILAKTVGNWITGEIFGWMNQTGETVTSLKVSPEALGGLLNLIEKGEINNTTAKSVLAEMLTTGKSATEIVVARGLRQISDESQLAGMVAAVLAENPGEVAAYLGGKAGLANWFFGQVMRTAKGKANPQVVREELDRQLSAMR